MKEGRGYWPPQVSATVLSNLAALESINRYGPTRPLPDLRPLLCHPNVLLAAYHRLRSKSANLRPGVDGATFDGLSAADFGELSRRLSTGAFRFGPSRRRSIPKASGGRRPLTVVPPRDRLVQEALRAVLERLFEPLFHPSSHGFRPGRGPHSALGEIQHTFRGISWFLEVDLEDCFGSIPHQPLRQLLKEQWGLRDEALHSLLAKALRAPVLEEGGALRRPRRGIPQGSALSPLLANIYLHQVDVWLDRERRAYERGVKRRENPEYRRRHRQALRLPSLRARRRALAALRRSGTAPTLVADPEFRRLRWVRYADDLLIGVAGPRSEVVELRNRLAAFLASLGLRLSPTKTLLTRATTTPASFLGHAIVVARPGAGPMVWRGRGKSGARRVRAAPRPAIYGNLTPLVARLEAKGYCRRGRRGVPTRVGRLVHYSPAQIVDHYRSLLLGLGAFYVGATNWAKIRSRLDFILRHSCARTLGAKLRLRTRRKVFRRFGKNLAVRDGDGAVVAELPQRLLWRLRRGFRGPGPRELPEARLERLAYAVGRTRELLAGPCAGCGAGPPTPLELHHVRKLSPRPPGRRPRGAPGPAPEDPLLPLLRKLRRKQVALCVPCHRRVHRGHYDGPSLRGGPEGEPRGFPPVAKAAEGAGGPKGGRRG